MQKCPVRQVGRIEPIAGCEEFECLLAEDSAIVVPAGKFQPGDYFVHLPQGTRLTPWLLNKLGLWDLIGHKGRLSGEDGATVGELGLGGLPSDGLAYTVHSAQSSFGVEFDDPEDRYHYVLTDLQAMHVPGFVVYLGDDAAPYLNLNSTDR